MAEGGIDALRDVCERVLNGDMPDAARQWAYAQKVVPFSKLSNHQADIEARAEAAAAADGTSGWCGEWTRRSSLCVFLM